MKQWHWTHPFWFLHWPWDVSGFGHPHKNLHRELDRDRLALLIHLDITTGFKIVDHNHLTYFLADVRVCRVVLKWLTSFLHGLGQKVVLGHLGTP